MTTPDEPVGTPAATEPGGPAGDLAAAGPAGGSGPGRHAEVTEPTAAGTTPTAPKKHRRGSFWRELPFLILIALVLALLIKTFLVQAFYIPSGSMEPTLHGCPGCSGDRVLVNKLVYRFRDPHRGEIIVFRGPQSWQDTPEFTSTPPSNPVARFFHDVGSALGVAAPSDKDFIKRVIGIAGDTVSCTNDHLLVNGHALTEPYIMPGAHECSGDGFEGQTVHVPAGRLFVMGDNRDESADSRAHQDDHFGTVPVSDVIGRAFVKVWPPSHWGTLPVPSTFEQHGLAALGGPLGLGLVGAIPVTVARRRVRSRRRNGKRPPR